MGQFISLLFFNGNEHTELYEYLDDMTPDLIALFIVGSYYLN